LMISKGRTKNIRLTHRKKPRNPGVSPLPRSENELPSDSRPAPAAHPAKLEFPHDSGNN
jgi:hypothetical protein